MAPKEFDKLQGKRVENRRAAEGRLMESSKKQFACANPSKSEKTERKLDQIRWEEDDKLQFNSYKAKPLPKETMVRTDNKYFMGLFVLMFLLTTIIKLIHTSYSSFLYF